MGRFALVLLGFAGCSEPVLSVTNALPTAEIVSPTASSSLLEGRRVSLQGVVGDGDGAPATLSATWRVADVVVCAAAPPDDDGLTTCEVVLPAGTVNVALDVRDAKNAAGTDEVVLTVSADLPPTAALSRPLDGAVVVADAPFVWEGVVADPEDAASDLAVRVFSNQDGELGRPTPDSSGAVSGSGALSAGLHLVTLEVTDSLGHLGRASAAVTAVAGESAPTCAVVAPADGATVALGASLSLQASAEDAATAPADLAVVWTSDRDGVVSTPVVGQDGMASSALTTLSRGVHQLALTVTDSVGLTCTDTVVVHVDGPPSVQITSPGPGFALREGGVLALRAVVADEEDAAPQLAVTVSSDRDGLLDQPDAAVDGTLALDLGGLSRGPHHLVVAVIDSFGQRVEDAVDVVVNGAPTAPTLSLLPLQPVTTDALVLEATASDPDGDALTYAVSWTREGAPVAGDWTIEPGLTTRDEVWTATVTASDALGAGPSASATVVITNTPPSVARADILPVAPAVGQALSCAASGADDVDGDAVSVALAWEVNGRLAGTGAVLPADGLVRGDAVVCVVTPDDGTDAGAPVASAAVVIGNSPPSLDGVVLSPDPAFAGDVVRCTPFGFADADGDADQTVVRWTVNGADAGEGEVLASAVHRGERLTCVATPEDGLVTGAPVSASTTVQNSPPVASSAEISPAVARAGDTLRCALQGYADADGDVDQSEVRWSVDGLDAGVGAVLGRPARSGERVRCTIDVSDGTDAGPTLFAEVRVDNTPPSLAGARVTPAAPYVTDALTCEGIGADDADGDAVMLDVLWWADGVLVGAGLTLPAGVARRDQAVLCEATPDDGAAVGATVRSAPVVVLNAAPTVASAALSPASPRRGEDVSCAAVGFVDADGDADQSAFAWTIDGVAAGVGALLPAGPVRGQVLTCAVTPSDGAASGPVVTASTVVLNTPPSADRASITPRQPRAGDEVRCALQGYADADGDPERLTFAWTVDGVDAGTGEVLAAPFGHAARLGCTIIVSDGLDVGAVLSDEVVAENTAPVASGVVVSPAAPTVGDALSCAVSGTFDPDGDPVTVALRWEVDGVVVGAGASLAPGFAQRGDAVVCLATPTDGFVSGDEVASDPVVVVNSAPSLVGMSLSPTPIRRTDAVTCAALGAVDPDGDAVDVAYAWTIDGAPAGAGPTLTAPLSRGETVTCRGTPDDGFVAGPPTSVSAVVANTSPTALSVVVSPPSPRAGEALSCTLLGFSDVDGDVDRSTFAWTVDGLPAGVGPTLGAGLARGQVASCTVSVSDGIDPGPVLGASVAVGNTPPVLGSLAITPSAPTSSDALQCVPGALSDADGDVVTVSVRWEVDGVLAGSGATLAAAARGSAVRCVGTPDDGQEAGASLASATVVVGNSAPTASAAEISPTPARATDVITCGAAGFSDADGDPDLSLVDWQIDGVAAGSGAVLPASVVRGRHVSCTVTPFDGAAFGPPVSASVDVVNAPPSAVRADITPDDPDRTTPISCAVVGYSDPDGDASASMIAWRVNGVAVGAGALLPVPVVRGDVVACEVTPFDGLEAGDVVSDMVAVGNAPPAVTSVTLGPSPLYTDGTATASAVFSDPDGDEVTASLRWTVDGVDQPDTGPTLPGARFAKHQALVVTVTPSDGAEVGAPRASSALVVSNSPPGAPSIDITPGSPFVYDGLRCRVTAPAVDLDGDVVDYAATWVSPEGARVGTTGVFPGDTVAAGLTTRGTWTCTVTPFDDEGVTGASATASVVVDALFDAQVVPLSLANVQIYGQNFSDTIGEGACPLATPDVDGDGRDDLVIGAPGLNLAAGNQTGGVRVFFGNNLVSGTARALSSAEVRIDGDQAVGDAGKCVIDAGDLDGDGRDEVLFSAPRYDTPAANAGRVYLFRGSDLVAGALSVSAAWRVWDGPLSADAAGFGLAGDRDIDGGGVPDLLIGAPQNGSRGFGAVYVMRGEALPASGPLTAARWTLTGVQAGDRAGEGVALGDLDGDGFAELIVGGPSADLPLTQAGALWMAGVDQLPPAGGNFSLTLARWRILGAVQNDFTGQLLQTGDLDLDGYDELIVGGPQLDLGLVDNGGVLVFSGATLPASGDVAITSTARRVVGAEAGDQAGSGIGLLPDVTSDGLPELLVGAPFRAIPATRTGDAALFTSQALPFATSLAFAQADQLFRGTAANVRAGRHVAGGDLDGDGRGDVVIAAPYESTFVTAGGRIYVVFAP